MGICYYLCNEDRKVVLDIDKSYWIVHASVDGCREYVASADSVRAMLAQYQEDEYDEQGTRYDPRDNAELVASWLDEYGPARIMSDHQAADLPFEIPTARADWTRHTIYEDFSDWKRWVPSQ